MLSVPTLWTVFVINFLAIGLIWAYVARTYPKFEAARFWAGSSFTGAIGGGPGLLVMFAEGSLWRLVSGGTVMIFPACLAAMGIERFHEQPVSWRRSILITASTCAGLICFVTVWNSIS